ncbi:MAG: Zn-ribbon domain-containing OB-fold protein [bacterium]
MKKKTIKTKKDIKLKSKKRGTTTSKTKRSAEVKFIGQPMTVERVEPAMVIQWPRTLLHHHTYGLLTPFFEGLKKGVLRATKCPTPGCEPGLWLPPRADCPDCHARMEWVDLPNPVIGEIFTFTRVEYPGFGIEISYPYYQIDVKIPGCCTIMKGYLIRGEAKIGMKVKAGFRTRRPTNTILDLYWEPVA